LRAVAIVLAPFPKSYDAAVVAWAVGAPGAGWLLTVL
jgi:hypothetical protein